MSTEQGPWGARDGSDVVTPPKVREHRMGPVSVRIERAPPLSQAQLADGPLDKGQNPVWAVISTVLLALFIWLLTGSWVVAGAAIFGLFVHEYGHVLAMNRLGMGPARIYIVPFFGGLAMTATKDALLAMTDEDGGPRRSKLLLGYAGWGEGQLEDELGENVWLTADADLDVIFDGDHESKWSRALAGLGVDAAMLSGQAGRA